LVAVSTAIDFHMRLSSFLFLLSVSMTLHCKSLQTLHMRQGTTIWGQTHIIILKTDLQTLFITAPANAVHHLISLTQDPLASVSLQDRW